MLSTRAYIRWLSLCLSTFAVTWKCIHRCQINLFTLGHKACQASLRSRDFRPGGVTAPLVKNIYSMLWTSSTTAAKIHNGTLGIHTNIWRCAFDKPHCLMIYLCRRRAVNWWLSWVDWFLLNKLFCVISRWYVEFGSAYEFKSCKDVGCRYDWTSHTCAV